MRPESIYTRRARTGRALHIRPPVVSRSSEYTYTPAWWVPGAHLQTLWGRLVRRPPHVRTRAERWLTPDGDEVQIHRLDPPPGASQEQPRLLLLHGLEGTIDSSYIQGTLAQAQAHGWAADVLIFRTCDGRMNRSRRMYHSGDTTDLDFVVRRLIGDHPGQPLVAAGFSLGGNVLLKWLGELGDEVPAQLRAAAAVSVPFDLERGSRHIERGFSRLYARHFLRSLRVKARAKLASYPDLFDSAALGRVRTLHDFDDVVTAPVHGFKDAGDYYSRASSIRYLSRIRRNTLLLAAFDDPFVPPDILVAVAIMAQENRNLHPEFHDSGGHVGFVSGRNPFRPTHYAELRVLEFLATALSAVAPVVREHRNESEFVPSAE
jgi:uncharacterized protein